MLKLFAYAAAVLIGCTSAGHALDLDNAYHQYRKPTEGHKAFAYSPLGSYWWHTGAATAAEARQIVLEGCETVRSPDERPCAVGDVDGRIVDKRFSEVLRGVMRQPITVTVERNGESRTYPGMMTVLRPWSPARRISLAYAGGSRTCRDGRAYLGLGIRFTIRCDGQVLNGRARTIGKRQSGFYKGALLFEARVRAADGSHLTFASTR